MVQLAGSQDCPSDEPVVGILTVGHHTSSDWRYMKSTVSTFWISHTAHTEGPDLPTLLSEYSVRAYTISRYQEKLCSRIVSTTDIRESLLSCYNIIHLVYVIILAAPISIVSVDAVSSNSSEGHLDSSP